MNANNWCCFLGGVLTGVVGIAVLACLDDKYGWKRKRLMKKAEEEAAELEASLAAETAACGDAEELHPAAA